MCIYFGSGSLVDSLCVEQNFVSNGDKSNPIIETIDFSNTVPELE